MEETVMDPYRVLVVDDSAFMRKIISDLIEQDSQFTVIGTAVNGVEAVASIEKYKPDVITLDLEMPIMNGLDALQHILKKHRLPIIMLSGISEANTRDTIKALQFGAFDFIRKPTGAGPSTQDIHSVGVILLEKLKIAALASKKRIIIPPVAERVMEKEKITSKRQEKLQKPTKNDTIKERLNKEPITLDSLKINRKEIVEKLKVDRPKSLPSEPAAKEQSNTPAKSKYVKPAPVTKPKAASEVKHNVAVTKVNKLIAIGTSTGGPRALHEVISALPEDLNAPIVVVQHMPPKFTKSLAQRLDSFSALKVVEAADGMALENGTVYVAPGGYHMIVVKHAGTYHISLNTQPPCNGHRPSVDILYESLIPLIELERHIVLMTGMGSDGAQGMKKLFDSGVTSTIAESEESCIVYGMPRSAIELGAADKVLPLTQIAYELIQKVMK